MKRAYLQVVLGLIVAGSSAYAQRVVSGGGTGRGESGFVEHARPASFHGGSAPVNIGAPRGFSRSSFVGDRSSGNHRVYFRPGDFGDHRVFRGGLFDHGYGHGRGVVVFAYGVPYYWYPSSYDYTDSGYDGPAPVYAAEAATDTSAEYTTDPDTQTEEYSNQDTDAYYQPGYQWGGELKLFHVTIDQFVTYLKAYILSASPVQQAAFRSGFVAHFGPQGQGIYDQAVQQAISQN